jgi:hypothetical protein
MKKPALLVGVKTILKALTYQRTLDDNLRKLVFSKARVPELHLQVLIPVTSFYSVLLFLGPNQ